MQYHSLPQYFVIYSTRLIVNLPKWSYPETTDQSLIHAVEIRNKYAGIRKIELAKFQILNRHLRL